MEVVLVALEVLTMLAVLFFMFILPIWLGIKIAKRTGKSPHWMWFGIYPFAGWVVFLILRSHDLSRYEFIDKDGFKIDFVKQKIVCNHCGKLNKLNKATCKKCKSKLINLTCIQCDSGKLKYFYQKNYLQGVGAAICMFLAFFCFGLVDSNPDMALPGFLGIALLAAGIFLLVKTYSIKKRYVRCIDCGSVVHCSELRNFVN